MVELDVKPRSAGEAADSLRKEGFVPAVVYGPKEPTTSVAINARALEHAWKEAGRTSVVRIRGAGDEKETLIKDVQLHPVSGRILHADFYALEKGKKITLAIPLTFVGQAPAEKTGHILVKALHEIEIEVAPSELPHSLPVDLTTLENVGDHITAADIKLPHSATLMTHGEEIVVSVTEFKEEKEPEPAPTAPAAEGAPTAQEAAPETPAAE